MTTNRLDSWIFIDRLVKISCCFGDAEIAAAQQMAALNRAWVIGPDTTPPIPAEALYDDEGNKATCAVVFRTPLVEKEFTRRVEALRGLPIPAVTPHMAKRISRVGPWSTQRLSSRPRIKLK